VLLILFLCYLSFILEQYKMKQIKLLLINFGLLVMITTTTTALAHFGMVIPSDSMVSQDDSRKISIKLSFSHPFERVGMDLVKPDAWQVIHAAKKIDLLKKLQPIRVLEHQAWQTEYPIKRPGIYQFYMKPKPYWEPAEDCFIIHHTKTVVAAFGEDEGWDEEIGIETEIVPLSKPFGLYAGNIFQGIVKLNGKVVPFAEVEVEYYNENKTIKAPSEIMITQTIKADSNGVFSYATPVSGWWGFAALNSANYTLPLNGDQKSVELGAVLWVEFHPFASR
jgi:cobalt/nickel transport protein